MHIIDAHVHVWPDTVAEKAVASLMHRGTMKLHYDATVSGLLADMKRTDVAVSIVQPVATKPGQVSTINEWVATISSERIASFGAMHPDFENPSDEIAKMAAKGLRGFKMHPEHQSFAPDEARLAPIYEAAFAHDLTIFFHAGHDEFHEGLHGTPESFLAVHEAFPGLKMVLAHLGGYRCWDRVAEILAGRDLYLDTAYTLGHLSDDRIVAMVREHGAHRVMFGSDGPWTDAAAEIARLRRLRLSDEQVEWVLGKTAERLLA